MTKYGTYPATAGVLDWISHRFDAVDFSSFAYWFERRKMVKLADDMWAGKISRRAAERVLDAYNKQSDQMLSLDELLDDPLDDRFVFSPAQDWIVFSDRVREILTTTEDNEFQTALEALAEGAGADWVLLYQAEEGTVHAFKTPYKGKRTINPSADQFADALLPGTDETFVLPSEVHGIIKQENEYDCHGRS